jgi:DNA adenine methylase
MIEIKPQRKHLYTPLRYPGGKTSLFYFFDKVIQYNELSNVKYIEPYAGGAGAALSLLILGKVDSIVINDFDPAIYSFWRCLLDSPEDLIQKIIDTPLTVEEWDKQKAIYKSKTENIVELGFATFFLNRTNRSGILTGGIIGGRAQSSDWNMDARYNKESLIAKVRTIVEYKDKIEVLNEDGLEVIKKYSSNPHSLFYVDPPYYEKGASLYLNSYKKDAHASLADALNSCAKDVKWMLTYDNVEPIRELYKERKNQEAFVLNYQAHSSRKGSEIMIFSDCLVRPPEA